MKLRAMVPAAMLAATTLLSAATVPKLIVLVVVDQMRADYVDRFKDEWTAGLKRLVTEGAWYSQAAYPYLTTVTCAGHATIGSGAFPHVHGVFQNVWYDRGRKALVTCTQDANVTALGYGRATTGGESAAALAIPNFADEMRRQRQSHVVSLALKARSAIMLGGHGGRAVTWISDSLDGWETSTAYATEPVPEVRAYLAAHPMEADYGKAWNRLLPIENYTEPDAGLRESTLPGWTTTFPHVLKGTATSANADPAFYDQWQRSPFADAYIARMALGLTESLGLGRDGRTDVLAISFSTPDLVGHAFGPASHEVQDIYAHLDKTIGELFDQLDVIVGKDQWVAGLSADHGVTPIPEQLVAAGKDAGRINGGAIVDAIEQVLKPALGAGRHITVLNTNDIYFEPGIYDKILKKRELMTSVISAIQARPGIQRAFRSEEIRGAAGSKDPLLRAAALSYFPGRSGDIVFAAKPGWMISAAGTTHGGASPDDQRVPILFVGHGVKPGTYQDAATPADIAPTLAALSGLSMKAEGRPLPCVQ